MDDADDVPIGGQAQDANFINKMKFFYKNRLFDQVMSDMFWAVFIVFIYLCVNAYLRIRANANLIRSNWPVYRCNPSYMPFAGMVMTPRDMSKMEYTQSNFEFCFQSMMDDMSSAFMEPLYYTQSVAGSTLNGIANGMNDVRALINNVRNAISSIIADIMGRTLNIMQPVITILIKIKDMLNKVMGILTANLYTTYGMYETMQSGLRSMFEIVVIILIAAGAALIAIWIALAIAIAFGPFGLIAVGILTATGVVLTAFYIGIAIPLGGIAHFLAETMDIHGLSLVPSAPSR